MEKQKENSKGNPSLIDEKLGSPLPSSQDTLNNSTDIQISKIHSQQSKCSSQQSKYIITTDMENQPTQFTAQCSPIRGSLFENIQEDVPIFTLQTENSHDKSQGSTSYNTNDTLKRSQQNEGMNKEGVHSQLYASARGRTSNKMALF
ncbi:hypothetical protein HAX54_023695 [Datura stramonium]|uniref:Uncharacterized protein n=1 Tax=Datura stramonium TaxID=4076 RepID=A0ABS8S4V6_DATST|nr:hypothetical protein [Datura stramonium]